MKQEEAKKNIMKLNAFLKMVKTKVKSPESLVSEEPPLYLG
jgi:hypothetical protein